MLAEVDEREPERERVGPPRCCRPPAPTPRGAAPPARRSQSAGRASRPRGCRPATSRGRAMRDPRSPPPPRPSPAARRGEARRRQRSPRAPAPLQPPRFGDVALLRRPPGRRGGNREVDRAADVERGAHLPSPARGNRPWLRSRIQASARWGSMNQAQWTMASTTVELGHLSRSREPPLEPDVRQLPGAQEPVDRDRVADPQLLSRAGRAGRRGARGSP